MFGKLIPYSKCDSERIAAADKRKDACLIFAWFAAVIIFISIGAAGSALFAATVAVNTTSDTHASSPSTSANDGSGNISLRSAIEYADYHSGTTVSVGSGTYNLTLGEIQIGAISTPTTTTINGAGAGSTIINQTDGTNRIFDIDPSIGGGIACTITGVTIENGKDKADGFGGGGIIDGNGGTGTSDHLTLTNCTIQNNTAYGDASTQEPVAGGVEMDGGYLTLTNCTISSNTLVTNTYGGDATGAGVSFAPFATSETLTISGCTFSNNTINVSSASGQGAGLQIDNTIVGGAGVSITNTVFSNNTFASAGTNKGEGGGIFVSEGGTLTMTGCTFTSNSAGGTGGIGGAIFSNGGTANINYCRFSGNSATSDANINVTGGGTVSATNDWWASNSGATGISAGVTATPYLKLTNTAARTTINSGDTTKLTASFLTNSAGSTISASNLSALSGLGVSWGSLVLGTLSNQQTSISSGIATATFTAGGTAGSNGSAQASVDGGTATTSPTITVNVGPSVTVQPTNQTVNTGQGASFTSAASGSPSPTVQWQVSTNGGSTWNNIGGATSTTYSFTTASTDNGKEYRAVFTNTVSSVNSNAAILTVDFAPTVTTNPANDTVVVGNSASFTSAANGNPAPTVQWQVSTDGGTTWTNVPGATGTTYSFVASITENGYEYRAVFTNGVSSATSNPALLVVKDNSLAVEVSSFKAAASYSSVALTWQTQSEVDNAGFNILRADSGTNGFKLIAGFITNNGLRGIGTSSTGKVYNFTDDHVTAGSTYEYEIQGVSTSGAAKNIDTLTVSVAIPKDFALYQNYPNPFNPSTTIRFDLKEQSTVALDIYNVLGQRVLENNYGAMNAGRFNEVVNMDRFASGVYFYRIAAIGNNGQKFVSIKKLVLMK
ncbi:MAG TPA: right-handed parallel beta-helix repeat-containing protein [Candidatus Acidoferrales bacterium]|nr:right-handed parallel beta-helix repeat-containing protein [Candidatus Acidoferrales bacterium]